jgi:hypothetical protein
MRNRPLSPSETRALGLRYDPPSDETLIQRRLTVATRDWPDDITIPKNSCALVAVIAGWQLLKKEGIRSRLLALASSATGGHIVTVFSAPDGTSFAFDAGGAFPMPPGISENSSAKAVARAYLRASGVGSREAGFVAAKWTL